MGGITGSRRVRVLTGMAVLGLLVTDLLAFRVVANRARPVPLARVIARYREQNAAGPTTSPGTQLLPISAATPAPTTAAAIARPTTTKAPVAAIVETPRALATPAPGVYLYATSGHEDTNAVGGVHHAYPDETTITVTPAPCGFTMRWDALEQRWDDWTACVTGRQVLVESEHMKHAFYGISDQRGYTCNGATLRPGPETAGTPVTGRCEGSGDVGIWSGRVIGAETVTVAGQAIAALHVFVQETMSGNTTGTRRTDDWFEAGSGLLLKRIFTVEGDSSTAAGRVHYSEAVTLVLKSRTPAR